MNPAALAQSQTLATLLQALNPASGLVAGSTVEARLLSVAGDGTAMAQLGDTRILLALAGPESRQAALNPGATLLLKLLPPEQPGTAMRATLLEVRPAPASSGPASPTLPPTTPASAAPLSPETASPAVVPARPVSPTPSPAQPPALAQAAGAPRQVPGTPLPQPVLASSPSRTPVSAPAVLSPSPPASQTVPAAANVSLRTASGSTLPAVTPVAIGLTAKAPAPAAQQSQAPAATSPSAAQATRMTLPAPPPATTAIAARAAAGPLLGSALVNQDGMAPLMANLRGLVNGTISSSVPRPVLKAANDILAQALPVERRPVTAEGLKQAVQRSGLFMEAHQSARPADAPQLDLKAGLVALRTLLEPMLAKPEAAPSARPAPEAASNLNMSAARPAPPRRDGPLALQPIAEPTLTAGDKPLAIAETLLRQTDSALDRITLSQYASLPAEPARGDAAPTQRWLAEVPLAFQAGTAMLPLQVEREPPKSAANGVEGPLWRVRFALDVEPMGPLQGVVTLQGRSVGVTLWAEREDTSRMLRSASSGLEAALLGANFENGTIDIHTGQPRVMQATAGQFLDRLS